VGIDSTDIERGAARLFRLDQEHLTVTSFDANGAVAPGLLEQGREFLASFRERVDGHGGTSTVVTPARAAAFTNPRSSDSNAHRCCKAQTIT
jgi:hypothetical protein